MFAECGGASGIPRGGGGQVRGAAFRLGRLPGAWLLSSHPGFWHRQVPQELQSDGEKPNYQHLLVAIFLPSAPQHTQIANAMVPLAPDSWEQ